MLNVRLKESEDLIREFFDYDPDTGLVTWIRPRKNIRVGNEAGCMRSDGYRQIKIGRKLLLTHRIAWFLHHGAWPEREVDHRNGMPYDNRISNLRDVTHQDNQCNRLSHRNGRLVGCRFHQGRWQARITVDGKRIFLGYFDTELEAHEAYMKARRMYAEIQQLRECV